MADSTELANLPPGFDLYAGYDDGAWPNAAAIAAQFPGKPVVRITVFPSDNEGDCLDVESGDAAPQDAPAWVQRRRAAGADPSVYCSEAIWQNVKDAFTVANEPQPHYWIAGYPGSVGEALYPGSVAHQWIDRGPYDESIVADYWPGIDPPPVPPTEGEEEMAHWQAGGQDHVSGVIGGTAYHWWQNTPGTAPPNPPANFYEWHVEKLPMP
ncbi:MAG TPA: hypothetical protein VNV87_12275 [Acidimicrobiales bacterium]|nr:hypothetical protein [Acidimicrobiales bacterium]